MKRYFPIVFFVIAFCLVQRFSRCFATDGFAVAKMAPLLNGYSSKIPPPSDLFTQRFTYLAKGGQCYAFISEDGRYILKFFRKNSVLLQTYASAQLAAETLGKETGLLHSHLGL